MRHGLLRTLAKRIRGQNHFSRSDRRNKSTRLGLDIFSIYNYKGKLNRLSDRKKNNIDIKNMALFGNKTKATALFFVLVFLLYGGKLTNVERTRRTGGGATQYSGIDQPRADYGQLPGTAGGGGFGQYGGGSGFARSPN